MMEEPYDLSWLYPDGRDEPIPDATADTELYVLKSNPSHIPSKEKGRFGINLTEYHIGYSTKWGDVALCGVGNDKIPTGCRCSPWQRQPERQNVDCAECYDLALLLHLNKAADELDG